MIKSMTGFAREEVKVNAYTFIIEIKSLNGKQFDLMLKIPALLKPYEFEIRKIIADQLGRGTAECMISLKDNGQAKPVTINTELAKAYYQSLAELAESLKLDTSQILNALLKLPEVIVPGTETLQDDEWIIFREGLFAALNSLNRHRLSEGAALEADLVQRIRSIMAYHDEIKQRDPLRIQKLREHLQNLLEQNAGKEKYDANRLEQELIYYIEKMDISEELVRLLSHCDYFLSLLQDADDMKGKKLSFVLQEIGREINTLGAKAYDAEMQKRVVMMKDELEKAKEQISNVL
ncbi:MAG: YicC family protein [Chitinophagaceae bacterium]|nr:YicC family protein [Chitinophagaceae bacterium]